MIDPTVLLHLSPDAPSASTSPLERLRRELQRLELELFEYAHRLRFHANALTEIRDSALDRPRESGDDDLRTVLVSGIDDLNFALASVVGKARQTASWTTLAPLLKEPDPHAIWAELDPGAPRRLHEDDQGGTSSPAETEEQS